MKTKKLKFVKDQILIYKGKGFLGYDKNYNTVKFIKYSDQYPFDVYVEYSNSQRSFEILVSIYDIE